MRDVSSGAANAVLSEPKSGSGPTIHVDEANLSALTQTGGPSPSANDEPSSGTKQASNNGFRDIFRGLSEARWFQRSPNGRLSSDANRRLSAATLPSSSGISRFGFVIFWLLMAIGYAAAVFSAIGGTMMQIMGVYRNCLCMINVNTWSHGRNDANLQLSTNSAEDIEQALKYWIPMGGAASGFLGMVAYVAWWYQRRLRFRFAELVSRLDETLPLGKSGQASAVVTIEGS
jgi:hypothetical protein